MWWDITDGLVNPYLGIELQSNLKLNKHVDKLDSREQQLVEVISRILQETDEKPKRNRMYNIGRARAV